MTDQADKTAQAVLNYPWVRALLAESTIETHRAAIAIAIRTAVAAETERCLTTLTDQATGYGWMDAGYVIDGEPLPVGKMCDELTAIIKVIREGAG